MTRSEPETIVKLAKAGDNSESILVSAYDPVPPRGQVVRAPHPAERRSHLASYFGPSEVPHRRPAGPRQH